MKMLTKSCLAIALVCASMATAQTRSLFGKSLSRANLSKSTFSHSLSDSIRVEWLNYFAADSASDGNDQAQAVAVDDAGNVYVTGSSDSPLAGRDFYTVKYSPSGARLWSARYDGSANWQDGAQALAVDTHGNVYVTGQSWGLDTSNDFATVKYNRNGEQQWAVRYNGPQNSDDHALAIAIDDSGNVAVAGISFDVVTSARAGVTVYYNNAGIEQWVVRQGQGDALNYSVAVALDDAGNVYVTGAVQDDFFTSKYNQNGREEWTAFYDGTGRGIDRAYALALDGSGNVYVGGTSYGARTNDDYVVVKYDAVGHEQWAALYDGETKNWDDFFDFAVDDLGNAYVTGMSEGHGQLKMVTVKFNRSGTLEWVQTYDGPGSHQALGIAIAVDRTGNAIVTGYNAGASDDYTTIKYSPMGNELWVRHYDGPGQEQDRATALAIDAGGNVYVTGESRGAGTGNDYATIKYDGDGNELWVARHNGAGPTNSFNCAYDIAVDDLSNVYVAGVSRGARTSSDFVTVKYNFAGELQWLTRYNGPVNGVDSPSFLKLDEHGNVYVAGWSYGVGTSVDYAVVKYDNAGVEQWRARYNGPGNGQDFINALAVDEQENVYVTGSSLGADQNTDFATIKYNAAGEERWVARYSGQAQSSSDVAYDLAVNASGEVIVTGSSLELDTGFDFTTIKYDRDGVEQWRSHYNGSGRFADHAYALALDAAGNTYVTGFNATVKYNSAGVQQWAASSQSLTEGGKFIRLDRAGNVYVLGQGRSAPGVLGLDYLLVKFNSHGIEQWHARYDGPGKSLDEPSDMVLDERGNVYVTGKSAGSGTSDDFATIKYDSAGETRWMVRFNSSANASDRATALAVDAYGGVYVTGCSGGPNRGAYVTIKYVQAAIVSVVERKDLMIISYLLSQNYPNPFNPETKIVFEVPPLAHKQRALIKIYDLLGRLVAVLFDREAAPGRYEVVWNGKDLRGHEVPSGIYIYRLQAGQVEVAKRMTLLR
ncbi:MAG: hypothetical protein DKINENOH_02538 [bacterium]|nr:hypothetical protein [bacterium]